MKTPLTLIAVLLAVLWLKAALVPGTTRAADLANPLPDFTATEDDAWIGSEPMLLADLRGQVLLVHFWAFECWNCYRSFPWLNAWERRQAGRPVSVIGVHTPEFDHEKDRQAVQAKIREFRLDHPVMLDNDYAYWRALENRYWPAWYVADAKGRLRGVFIGEVHAGDPTATAIESLVEELMAEAAEG